jgi:hypothetical protein
MGLFYDGSQQWNVTGGRSRWLAGLTLRIGQAAL